MDIRITILSLLAVVAWSGDVVLDRVVLKEKGARDCWIVSESFDEQKWKNSPESGSENPPTRRSTIKSIVYGFKRGPSLWTQGVEARERGRFEEAATLFSQLAQGQRECEKVIGYFDEGVAWDMAGKVDDAAKAFQNSVDAAPNHPNVTDGMYRLGMVLAQSKAAAAEEVAKKLDAMSLGKAPPMNPKPRAAAIRVAIAQAAGDDKGVRSFMPLVALSPENDRETWLHFKLYVADTWRSKGKMKEAASIYEDMLPKLNDDPATASRVRLGIGVCGAEGDRQGAIIVLVGLDALPFGSPEQKCEARYHAGRLLLAEAADAEKDPTTAKDERRKTFISENRRSARQLLQTAAEATVSVPFKDQAAELLKTLAADGTVKPPEVKEPVAPDPAKDGAKTDTAKPAEGGKDKAAATEPAKAADGAKKAPATEPAKPAAK
ncbi:MAG: hypothetical protein AAB263_18620 [Planctomycetota bacterium]